MYYHKGMDHLDLINDSKAVFDLYEISFYLNLIPTTIKCVNKVDSLKNKIYHLIISNQHWP